MNITQKLDLNIYGTDSPIKLNVTPSPLFERKKIMAKTLGINHINNSQIGKNVMATFEINGFETKAFEGFGQTENGARVNLYATFYQDGKRITEEYFKVREKLGLVDENQEIKLEKKEGLYQLTEEAAEAVVCSAKSLLVSQVCEDSWLTGLQSYRWGEYIISHPDCWRFSDFLRYDLNDWVIIAELSTHDGSCWHSTFDSVFG